MDHLSDEVRRELEKRIKWIKEGERPREMTGSDWLMPCAVCAAITVFFVASIGGF
ncbi:hypothetical protein [Arhodomonas sp. AD133]|uniref:hypothetical protein n=1 Tax=Arhodomonas sp. AD133 TaxID=3415009 RepID=UPI003EB923A8